jgi:hypothetical protein
MGIFDFFNYTPSSFFKEVENNLIPMDPKDILNMKANKVSDNFDEKYKDNEEYKQLPGEQRNAIFLLRVLKKGLNQEDKDRALSICINNEKNIKTAIAIAKQPTDAYSKYDKNDYSEYENKENNNNNNNNNSKRSKIPSMKPGPSLEQRQRAKTVPLQQQPQPAAPAPTQAPEEASAPEETQEGGGKHKHQKTRHGRNKRRGVKKTKRRQHKH